MSSSGKFSLVDRCVWRCCHVTIMCFEWHKRFVEGRNQVEDEQRVGRPCSSKIDDIDRISF